MRDDKDTFSGEILTGMGFMIVLECILLFSFFVWMDRTDRSLRLRINQPGEEGTVIEIVHPRDR